MLQRSPSGNAERINHLSQQDPGVIFYAGILPYTCEKKFTEMEKYTTMGIAIRKAGDMRWINRY